METVKEKLTKLVKMGLNRCGEYAGTFDDSSCSGCRYRAEIDCLTARVVDALIDGGATIQEWVSVDERLPEESLNSVLGWDEYRERCVFVQYYNGEWILGNHDSVKVTHWCPLPQPPKEVQ